MPHRDLIRLLVYRLLAKCATAVRQTLALWATSHSGWNNSVLLHLQ